MSFLNVGSGSGYLSCLAACLLGDCGLSHGIDCNLEVVRHSEACCKLWFENIVRRREEGELDVPLVTREGVSFVHGNCFQLDVGGAASACRYDRIYVGAGCPEHRKHFFYSLLVEGGIMVASINERRELIQIRRRFRNIFTETSISSVIFAPLIEPPENSEPEDFRLPPSLHGLNQSSFSSTTGTSEELSAASSPTQSYTFSTNPLASSSSSSSSTSASTASSMSSSPLVTMLHSARLSVAPLASAHTSSTSSPSLCPRSNNANALSSWEQSSRVRLPPVLWAPTASRHRQFPPPFRAAVLLLLLACNKGSPTATMPMLTGGHGNGGCSGMGRSVGGGSSSSTSSASAHPGRRRSRCHVGAASLPQQLWMYVFTFASRYN
jgi:protein-L-isoaspartate O-methyltransferase